VFLAARRELERAMHRRDGSAGLHAKQRALQLI